MRLRVRVRVRVRVRLRVRVRFAGAGAPHLDSEDVGSSHLLGTQSPNQRAVNTAPATLQS